MRPGTFTGILLVLFSAVSFAVSTVFAKLVTTGSDVPAPVITLFRFGVGFVAVSIYILIKRKPLKPVKARYVLLRVIFNTGAVIFFFLGIQYSTVSKANMLNMTYPFFVFLIAPFINSEKHPASYYLYLLLTMAGIYFIFSPGAEVTHSANIGDVYALISGVFAGFAIAYLREARKYDASYLIIFYLMFLGGILNLFISLPVFVMPEGMILVYTILSAACAVTGQFFITVGYRYINAAAGSLVSATRILFAILLGVSIFSDPLTLNIVAGGALIIISICGVSGFLKIKKTGHA